MRLMSSPEITLLTSPHTPLRSLLCQRTTKRPKTEPLQTSYSVCPQFGRCCAQSSIPCVLLLSLVHYNSDLLSRGLLHSMISRVVAAAFVDHTNVREQSTHPVTSAIGARRRFLSSAALQHLEMLLALTALKAIKRHTNPFSRTPGSRHIQSISQSLRDQPSALAVAPSHIMSKYTSRGEGINPQRPATAPPWREPPRRTPMPRSSQPIRTARRSAAIFRPRSRTGSRWESQTRAVREGTSR